MAVRNDGVLAKSIQQSWVQNEAESSKIHLDRR